MARAPKRKVLDEDSFWMSGTNYPLFLWTYALRTNEEKINSFLDRYLIQNDSKIIIDYQFQFTTNDVTLPGCSYEGSLNKEVLRNEKYVKSFKQNFQTFFRNCRRVLEECRVDKKVKGRISINLEVKILEDDK